MISMYLNGKISELEVNIPNSISNAILKNRNQGNFDKEILNDLEKAIYSNLNDTYLRLIFTTQYKEWENHHKFLKETHIE